MGALKRPDAEMHDSGVDRGAVVTRARDVGGQVSQGCLAEPHHR
jgi:hypothetical protein